MIASEMNWWLGKQGATFEIHKGGSGHLTVRLNGRTSQLPQHDAAKELRNGLVQKITKDLGFS